jgi:hypothetical protein
MSISITTDHFELDDIALVFHAFGHTVCWLRGQPGELIVDRSDDSAWRWSKKHGRWTTLGNRVIRDGWLA